MELLVGVHNFTGSPGDAFKLSLYADTATLNKSTTAYTASNEVGNSGSYSAGGGSLDCLGTLLSTDTACVDFADISFTSATITARGALIYNSSKSNAAVVVLDFGSNKTSTAGTFAITFPTPDASNAILRIA